MHFRPQNKSELSGQFHASAILSVSPFHKGRFRLHSPSESDREKRNPVYKWNTLGTQSRNSSCSPDEQNQFSKRSGFDMEILQQLAWYSRIINVFCSTHVLRRVRLA
jgi:hypothetical protein